MKRPKSLRWQIFTLMAVIAIMECVVLILSVSLSGVFTQLDAEAFRFFSNNSAERAISLDNKTGQLIRNITNEVNEVNADAQALAAEQDVSLNEVYRNDDLYNLMTENCAEHLVQFLNGNSVTGAFFILNGSNTNKEDPAAHSAVYIRDSAPGLADDNNDNLQLAVGPIAIARTYKLMTADRWQLDMTLGDDAAYYLNPIEAAEEYPRSELVRYGYWSPPATILSDSQDGISYTLPLLDSSGEPFGVMGFEISLSYFTKEYFSNTNLPYQNSFFAVTSADEDHLDTSWVIPGTPLAQANLFPGENIPIDLVSGTDIYETSLSGLGNMYCSVNELTMYSRNSPFANERWVLAGMVQQSVMNETSKQVSRALWINMAVTLGVSFIAIFLLTFFSTRKIVNLSRYVNRQDPVSAIVFPRTDLREIDELTSALERLNRRISDSVKVTSKIMELTQLPLGGYEVSKDLDTVMLTEYIYSLLHLKQGEPVSKELWESIYSYLTSHPADGYADVYRYDLSNIRSSHYGDVLPSAEKHMLHGLQKTDAEDTYHSEFADEKQKWLRIIETQTDTGTVGMIQDVTADIEEFLRLTHELDYDALTHLYNRTAFKREAFKKITNDPDKVGALIFSDLDNLKFTNDNYGHEMGDKLITTASNMFREFADYGGIVARISGDEFAIFLYGFDSKEDIMEIVHRLYEGFSKRYLTAPDGTTHKISYSSGIAWYPDDSRDIGDLLKLSDYAMYEAKHNKKGSLFIFDEESYRKNGHQQKSRKEIGRLINDSLFNFLFQPIVVLATSEVFGYEALMYSHIENLKTPLEILTAARVQSKLGQLESDVIFKALSVVHDHADILEHKKIFVNSIAGQCLSEAECRRIEHSYGRILQDIVLEITEEENNDVQKMNAKLRMIRDLGMHLAIDDFGAGYSNEVRIIAMQPDIVKIDLSLIHDLHTDSKKQTMVHNLIAFCHARGIRVAAECVETAEDLELVMKLGMDYAQGFLLGRPSRTFEELTPQAKAYLEKWRRDM